MSTDSDLQRAVLDELRWEPSVEAARIGVTANAGVVTLTRHVQNYSQKLGAEKAASRVKGVKAVAEEIDVKLPYDLKRGDEDIAAAAIDRLGWNSNIPDHAIQVNVGETLSGIGAPMPEKSILKVLGQQRLSQQGIVSQVDHPGAEVVAGAPVSIDTAQFIGRERLFRR